MRVLPTEITEEQWKKITRKLMAGRCVPFLGAGASMGFEGPGLPSARELARELAVACNYEGVDQEDFLRICQYYELENDPDDLRQFIIARLTNTDVRPSKIHRVLARLPVTHVITTNYDTLMEAAFAQEKTASGTQKKPIVAIHDIQSRTAPAVPAATVEAPMVYKLHGSVEQPTSMICTEDDVVQFVARLIHEEPGLPPSIQALFETCSFLFIGYGLRDWNVRVMIRAMRWRFPGRAWTKSFAIQQRPREPGLGHDWDRSVIYWDQKEQIQCFNQDAREFVLELGARYEDEVTANQQPGMHRDVQSSNPPGVQPGVDADLSSGIRSNADPRTPPGISAGVQPDAPSGPA